ncbi:MAG: hypothetical protein AVDCRST_MAG61-2398, partial [uncultured Friedmanniella sp.]
MHAVAGVVDQHVDAAQPRHRLLHRALHLVGVGDVGGDDVGANTQLLHLGL